jgi:hypothetical protein
MVLIQAAHGNSGCPWVFGRGNKSVFPYPLTVVYIKPKARATGGQLQRALTQTFIFDFDSQKNSAPPRRQILLKYVDLTMQEKT